MLTFGGTLAFSTEKGILSLGGDRLMEIRESGEDYLEQILILQTQGAMPVLLILP